MNTHEFQVLKARTAVAKAEYLELNIQYQAERHAQASAKRINKMLAKAIKDDAKAAKARISENGRLPTQR